MQSAYGPGHIKLDPEFFKDPDPGYMYVDSFRIRILKTKSLNLDPVQGPAIQISDPITQQPVLLVNFNKIS